VKTFLSDLSKKPFPVSQKVAASSIRQSLLGLIQQDHPAFSEDDYLAQSELKKYRKKLISQYLTQQVGELTTPEKTVLAALSSKTTLADKLEEETDEVPLTLGQRVADKVATFGGSWTFILSFGAFLVVWILTNVFYLANQGFDPYPFILLNLILSCIAALQAPIIMMSQNRQEEKDRERAEKDYMINLKAEMEIRILHEKIDHLILHQQQELLENQKKQMKILHTLLHKFDLRDKQYIFH